MDKTKIVFIVGCVLITPIMLPMLLMFDLLDMTLPKDERLYVTKEWLSVFRG